MDYTTDFLDLKTRTELYYQHGVAFIARVKL